MNDASAVRRAAVAGTAGPGQPLPYLQTIQRSFGRHSVGHVIAHTGPEARQGATAMGATAFATGNHVAFAGTPDLRTAAHEAAHVVQQQAGIQLKGGVGQVGDAHERHADEVAEQVVAGRSAERLLNRYAPASGADAGKTPTPERWRSTGSTQRSTVQQNSIGQVVQRNLGFEFQTFKEGGSGRNAGTGFKKYIVPPGKTRGIWTKFNDHDTYANGPGWRVDSDGGDLEVVTDHAQVTEDRAGRIKLGQILDNVETTLSHVPKIGDVSGKGPHDVTDLPGALPGRRMTGEGTDRSTEGVRLLRTPHVEAHPQATIGMPLDKLLEMMELLSKSQQEKDAPTAKETLAKKIGWYKGDEAERLRGNIESSVDKARGYVEDLADSKLSDKFTGFLALIGSYILGGSADQAQVYGKNVTPFMSRSNLVRVFESMSEHEQKQFRYIVTTSLAMNKLVKAMAWPIKTRPADASALFSKGTKEGSSVVRPETKFSIVDWLADIVREVKPIDRLTSTKGPDPDRPTRGDEYTFRGFGTMGLDAGKTVVELRKLRGKVKLADWKQFALDMFDLLTLVNHGKRMVAP